MLPPRFEIQISFWNGYNCQRFDLVRGVPRVFRIKDKRSSEIIGEFVGAVRKWEDFAKQLKWPNREVAMMTPAFRVA